MKCPYCAALVNPSKLDTHLRSKCELKQVVEKLEAQTYYIKNYNSSRSLTTDGATPTPHEMSAQPLPVAALARQIDRILTKKAEVCVHECPPEAMRGFVSGGSTDLTTTTDPPASTNSTNSTDSLPVGVAKHVVQHRAIAWFLRSVVSASGTSTRHNPVTGDSKTAGTNTGTGTLIEMGAGKGMLSLDLLRTDPTIASCVVMVEREKRKNNADDLLSPMLEYGVQRLSVDIRHLYLAGLMQTPQEKIPLPMFGVGKHVCGAATDLSVRCLVNYARDGAAPVSAGSGGGADSVELDDTSSCPLVGGAVFAVCCHHMCTWEDYVGQTWWTEELGLDRADFELAVRVTSWVSIAKFAQDEESVAKRQKGVWCKRLIDMGRVHFLRQNGLRRSHLQTYCASTITVENCLLIAKH